MVKKLIIVQKKNLLILLVALMIALSVITVIFNNSYITLYYVNKEKSSKTLPRNFQKPFGILPITYDFEGVTFNETGVKKEVSNEVTLSVIYSFSPWIDGKIKKMYYDASKENELYATGPAIIKKNNELLVVQRIWVAQYERDNAFDKVTTYWNTWKENMAFEYRFTPNYKIKSNHLLGIPTPINCQYSYRADGVYDPRLSIWKNKVYMTFHLWMYDFEEKEIKGRMYIWDYENQEMFKLKLPFESLPKLQRAEINWVPLVTNDTLYFVYSMDPLRILKCDDNFHCHFVHLSKGEEAFSFDYLVDKLRGGSPFLEYQYPYYISVAHSQIVGRSNMSYYASHFLVLSIEPTFRIVYVSKPIKVNEQVLKSGKIVREHTIAAPFIYPVGLIINEDGNSMDIGVHLNDNRGFILRMHGLSKVMKSILQSDKNGQVPQQGPPLQFVQTTVGKFAGQFFGVSHA